MTIAGAWSGWLTCSDCSSMGWDASVGDGTPPRRGTCAGCGGPWPRGERLATASVDTATPERLCAANVRLIPSAPIGGER